MNRVEYAWILRRHGSAWLPLIVVLATVARPAHAQDRSFQSQGVELHYKTAGGGTPGGRIVAREPSGGRQIAAKKGNSR